MILINGTKGIGTGWSTDIPKYNPSDVLDCMKKLLNGEELEEIKPWYRNYDGTFIKTDDKTFMNLGVYEIVNNNTLKILELPIGVSTEEYKDFLDKVVSGNDPKIDYVENYENSSTDTKVCFVVLCKPNSLKKLILAEEPDEYGCNKIYKEFKLVKNMSLNNLVLYNTDFKLTRYESPLDIIKEFYTYRLVYYSKRKNSLLSKYTHKKNILENKIRFIQEQIDDILVLYKKKRMVIKELEDSNYMKITSKEGANPIMNIY